MELITLGTQAGPAIRGSETGISSAVVIGDSFYMVDFGLGCTRAAHEAELRGHRFRTGFVTHLHSDHVIELPGFLLWNWGQQVDGFTTPVRLLGPGPDDKQPEGVEKASTEEMVHHMMRAFSYDLSIRTRDEGRPPLHALTEVSDVAVPPADPFGATGPFQVYEDDDVRVTATLVDHPPVRPALAFRFDTDEGSITFSGDTAECDALAALASDTDILVHEAVNLDYYMSRGFNEEFLNHHRQSHTTPEGAGRVAKSAGAKRLVLSHLAGAAPADFWLNAAESTYGGVIHVARGGEVYRVG
jgi:ribonuclease BN (tRNA processing enzyme)